jgi:hypothetical protein
MRRGAKSALIGKWRIIDDAALGQATNQPSKLANGEFFSSLLDQ